ncbi:unnamed protein product [Phaeothamnion confervicola]
MPKKGGKRRKTRTHDATPPAGAATTAGSEEKIPRSFVCRMGKVHQNVSHLVEDLRRVMEPHTARKLRERASSTVKDYVAVSSTFGVTHLLMLSQTEQSLNLRVARSPDGPTLTFKVTQYSLMRQVRALQKRPIDVPHAYSTSPLVVLNNFGDSAAEPHIKIMKITLQNIFPALNVATVKLAECRRVVLFHYDRAAGEVEMRHYGVSATPTGVTRAIRKVVQAKVPDLRKLEDISEFVQGGAGVGAGLLSDSEADDEDSKVVLPDKFGGRGNARAQRSTVKLQELGPRLRLKLMKVERGIAPAGTVLYHAYLTKTPDEVAALQQQAAARDTLKRKRRDEQAGNVARKRAALEEKQAAKAERVRAKQEAAAAAAAAAGGSATAAKRSSAAASSDSAAAAGGSAAGGSAADDGDDSEDEESSAGSGDGGDLEEEEDEVAAAEAQAARAAKQAGIAWGGVPMRKIGGKSDGGGGGAFKDDGNVADSSEMVEEEKGDGGSDDDGDGEDPDEEGAEEVEHWEDVNDDKELF